jgi:hypothetical protein
MSPTTGVPSNTASSRAVSIISMMVEASHWSAIMISSIKCCLAILCHCPSAPIKKLPASWWALPSAVPMNPLKLRPKRSCSTEVSCDLKCLVDNVRSGLIEQDRHNEGNQAER